MARSATLEQPPLVVSSLADLQGEHKYRIREAVFRYRYTAMVTGIEVARTALQKHFPRASFTDDAIKAFLIKEHLCC